MIVEIISGKHEKWTFDSETDDIKEFEALVQNFINRRIKKVSLEFVEEATLMNLSSVFEGQGQHVKKQIIELWQE